MRFLSNMIWQVIAWFVAFVFADYLIKRAMRTPYVHLQGYMERFWLFNPYSKDAAEVEHTPIRWLPSIRIHHILREDFDRDMHDHPWNARTIILKHRYYEDRLVNGFIRSYVRKRGQTATLRYGEFHKITAMPSTGVWTLFITWKYQGGWGFLVNGKKIPWRDYLAHTGGTL